MENHLEEFMLNRGPCQLCGDVMSAGGRRDRKYCTASCRTLAYRSRREVRNNQAAIRPKPLIPKMKEVAHIPEAVPLTLDAVRSTARSELEPVREQVADMEMHMERINAHIQR